jgi:hypothetical protein
MAKQTQKTATNNTGQETKPAAQLSAGKIVLGRDNYYLMIIGLVVIIIGFILMSGGGYTDPNVFPEEEIYSTRRITIAPIVVILGFAVEVYAVFHKSKK